jgi:two-component system phosphate regulon sensor histidine kinase PhoR
MVLTITVIALFQAYWLRKNYVEENRLLTLRTQLLFRETLFKLQATKLHLDTSFSFRMPDPAATGALNMANVVQKRLFLDSTGHTRKDEVFISVAGRAEGLPPPDDSGRHTVFYKTSAKVTQFLSGIDSLQDSVTVKEIDAKFRQVLAREGIRTSFTITVTPLERKKGAPHIEPDDNVILGFSNPRSYSIRLENTFWLTARRLGPQVLFSLVLVGITIFSFLLLYRNWRRQQKLTILKNDFISNITHELKTPIATVSVAVEALKEFDALKDPVRTKEYLEISTHELQRLSLLVDKVLKLSLFERQEIQLKKDEFDMKTLIEDVMTSMRLQFEKHQAKVRLTAGPIEPGKDKFFLRGDKLHFTSVIYNLLDNALKYTKTIPKLLINLHGEQDFLLLTVTDNGIGIPADYKDRIFEKFFRVPTGDHHNVKGYGLGLSYVAYVVQRHGGEISVRSEEGVGSQFRIKIPRGYA